MACGFSWSRASMYSCTISRTAASSAEVFCAAAGRASKPAASISRAWRMWLVPGLGVHDAVHAIDGFVDLRGVLEADGDRVHAAEVHRETHCGVAIFLRELTFTTELHT